VVHSFPGAPACHLIVFSQESGQLQGLEVMGQQDLGSVAHDDLPPSRLR
jgi:hypothetical protein